MTVDFGNLVIAIASFTIGTLIPIIYRRFSHEGISIRRPFEFDCLLTDNDTNNHTFVTILKIANATKESALLEDVQLKLPTKKGIKIYISEKKIKVFDVGDLIYVPIDRPVRIFEKGKVIEEKEYHFEDNKNLIFLSERINVTYLPLVIKADEDKLVAIQFTIPGYQNKDITNDDLYANRAKEAIRIFFKINGKYRQYIVNLR